MCIKKQTNSHIRTSKPRPLLLSDLADVLTRFSLRTKVNKGHAQGEGTSEHQRKKERERERAQNGGVAWRRGGWNLEE